MSLYLLVYHKINQSLNDKAGLAVIPTINEMAKPILIVIRSLSPSFNAYFTLLFPDFLTAIENSLPPNKPIKHQVVLIGTFDIILNTRRTSAMSKSTKDASGISLILDFSSTTS